MTLKEKMIIREAIKILEKQLSEESNEAAATGSELVRVDRDGVISFVKQAAIAPDEKPNPDKPLPQPKPPRPLNRVF
jgi:hypothetical protein